MNFFKQCGGPLWVIGILLVKFSWAGCLIFSNICNNNRVIRRVNVMVQQFAERVSAILPEILCDFIGFSRVFSLDEGGFLYFWRDQIDEVYSQEDDYGAALLANKRIF